jgi:hypothetical protein
MNEINKNVGSEYHNLRALKLDELSELLQEFITEFDVVEMKIDFNKKLNSTPDIQVGFYFDRYLTL